MHLRQEESAKRNFASLLSDEDKTEPNSSPQEPANLLRDSSSTVLLSKIVKNTKKMANETESKFKEKTQELAEKFEQSGVQEKIALGTDVAVTKTLSVGVDVYLKSADLLNDISVSANHLMTKF